MVERGRNLGRSLVLQWVEDPAWSLQQLRSLDSGISTCCRYGKKKKKKKKEKEKGKKKKFFKKLKKGLR